MSQFFSPLTNLRTDSWGGDAVRRRRFLLDVVRQVRAAVGDDVPVAVKLNSADFQRGGFTEDESLEVVRELGEAGLDLLEVSGGTYEKAAMMGAGRASTQAREAYFLDYAAKAREVSDVALMVTGGFATPAGMEAALRSGALDVIGLGWRTASWRSSGTPGRCTGSPPASRSTGVARSRRWCRPG